MSRRLAAALLALALATPALAQPAGPAATGQRPAMADGAPGGPAWSALSPAQQTALAPLKAHWQGIDAVRKAKWIVVAQRFPAMPAAERQRVQARMTEWAAMSPAERGRARLNFQELRNLPAPDRQALWEAYRALPPEEQRELAQRARPAAPATAAGRSADMPGSVAPRRVVPVNPTPVPVKPVTPTVVQVKPGATTTLVGKPPSPPPHNQPGLPKIAATPGFVNPSTLLPSRGPQGAATIAVPTAPAAAPRPAKTAAPGASASTRP